MSCCQCSVFFLPTLNLPTSTALQLKGKLSYDSNFLPVLDFTAKRVFLKWKLNRYFNSKNYFSKIFSFLAVNVFYLPTKLSKSKKYVFPNLLQFQANAIWGLITYTFSAFHIIRCHAILVSITRLKKFTNYTLNQVCVVWMVLLPHPLLPIHKGIYRNIWDLPLLDYFEFPIHFLGDTLRNVNKTRAAKVNTERAVTAQPPGLETKNSSSLYNVLEFQKVFLCEACQFQTITCHTFNIRLRWSSHFNLFAENKLNSWCTFCKLMDNANVSKRLIKSKKNNKEIKIYTSNQ